MLERYDIERIAEKVCCAEIEAALANYYRHSLVESEELAISQLETTLDRISKAHAKLRRVTEVWQAI